MKLNLLHLDQIVASIIFQDFGTVDTAQNQNIFNAET
jgi:hypothetical protein